ncbi:hypothetical protein GCM10018966_044200 [Streptomyces yanii]
MRGPRSSGRQEPMAVFVALGAFLMALVGGWVARRITARRHLVLGLAGALMLGVVGLDLLPEAVETAGERVFGVRAALLLFVGGLLLAHLVERLLAVRQAAHGAIESSSAAPGASTRGGGALLYLAAAEILPEAHHAHPARSTLLYTVAGVAFIRPAVGTADRRRHPAALSTNRRATPGAEAQCVCR